MKIVKEIGQVLNVKIVLERESKGLDLYEGLHEIDMIEKELNKTFIQKWGIKNDIKY